MTVAVVRYFSSKVSSPVKKTVGVGGTTRSRATSSPRPWWPCISDNAGHISQDSLVGILRCFFIVVLRERPTPHAFTVITGARPSPGSMALFQCPMPRCTPSNRCRLCGTLRITAAECLDSTVNTPPPGEFSHTSINFSRRPEMRAKF